MRAQTKPRRQGEAVEALANLAEEAPCRYFGRAEGAELVEGTELVGGFDHVVERRQRAGDAPACGPAILASGSPCISDTVLLAAEQVEIDRGRKTLRLFCPQIDSAEVFDGGGRMRTAPAR